MPALRSITLALLTEGTPADATEAGEHAKYFYRGQGRRGNRMLDRCRFVAVSGDVDQEFVDINAMASNATISGSILTHPNACFVMMMALPFGSTLILGTAQDIGT
jgi:hypothetical protein